MQEAFARFEDGKPFFRDLKVLEIVEDMEILQNIENQFKAEKLNLPPITRSSLGNKQRSSNH